MKKVAAFLFCVVFSANNYSEESRLIDKISFPLIMGIAIKAPTKYENIEYQKALSNVDVLILNFWPAWKEYKYGPDSIQNVLRNIKNINPDILIGQYTILAEAQDSSAKDKSKIDKALKIESEDWWLKTVGKKKARRTAKYNAWDINFTSFVSTDQDGMRYPQWLAERNYRIFFKNNSYFDFWFLDMSLNSSPIKLADWDRDGIPELSSSADLSRAYRLGHVSYWNAIKALQPGTLLLANSNNLLSDEYRDKLNGALLEALIGKTWSLYEREGWRAVIERYYSFIDNTLEPNLVGFNVWGKATDYQRLRFGLATCLMNNGYFSYTDEKQGYSSVPWFDEYEVDLGMPIDPPPSKEWINGLYRRAYEKGLVIVNPTGSSRTIVLESGYRKFSGKQDPIVNDGMPVNELTVKAYDGILLVKENNVAQMN